MDAELSKLSVRLTKEIEASSVNRYQDDARWHLGASSVGAKCLYQVWLSYRWIYFADFTGRQLRLFNRGDREEPQIVEMLKDTGWQVHVPTPETKHLFRFSYVSGHFGGTADGVVLHKDYFDGSPILLETKTHNTKSFSNLSKEGTFQIAKPQHWTQTNVYCHGLKLTHGLYFPVNKNDDDIRPEFFKAVPEEAESAIRKAEEIIFGDTPPKKVAGASPTFFECKMCDAYKVCQTGSEESERNCRSCKNSKPVANAEWECSLYGIIPKEKAIFGCPKWEGIFVR